MFTAYMSLFLAHFFEKVPCFGTCLMFMLLLL